MGQEKQKMRGGEKGKSKTWDCCMTFTPKNYLEIWSWYFASGTEEKWQDAWPTLNVHINSVLALYREIVQWPENGSMDFKKCFAAKFPGAHELVFFQ